MPTYNRNLDDAQPPAQQSGSTPFTIANFQEAPDVSGAPGARTTRSSITLSPVEPDVTDPLVRDLTTDAATLTSGWYGVLWEKANGTLYEGGMEFFDGTGDANFTYDTATNVGQVRLKVGDTDETSPLLSDEEIDAVLTGHTIIDTAGTAVDLTGAAADSASAIAAKFARGYTFSTDGQSFNRSERVAHYQALARELRSRQGGSSIPIVSSVTAAIDDAIVGG